MGKGLRCHIFSIYKQYFGTENGTLLRAIPNNKLFFDGTDNVPSTKFVKTNSAKNCTFHVIQDGTTYYVNETNDSISLKSHSPGTAFRVKSVTRSNPIVSIQSTKSGRYMIADEAGRLKMQNIEDTSRNLRAWFRIEEAEGKDEVDGHPSDGLIQLMITPLCDHNNNTPTKRSMAFDGVDPAIEMKNNKCIFDRSFTLPFSFWNASVILCGYMYNMLYYCLSRSK